MEEADERSKYLGLPNILGRHKSSILGFVKNKITSIIQSWSNKKFSKPSKEILIKFVLQALLTYAMIVFLLPLEITREMDRSLSKFWCDETDTTSRKIHWVSWDRLCNHKMAGGMGFRNFNDFNMSMVGKQVWRLVVNPEILVARLYKAQYYANGTLFEAKVGHNPKMDVHGG